MRSRRYGSKQVYRGRGGGSAALKLLVAALAVLLAGSVVFLLFMGKYIQYTDEGVKLELPWLREEEPPALPSNSAELIITQAPSPSLSPALPAGGLTAAEASPGQVSDGSASALARQAGADALVVTVKDEKGDLAWQSALTLAQADMNGDEAFGAAVAALSREGELHLTARLPAFRDLWASVYQKELALTTPSGKLWYDSGGISWLSPASPEARAYITALCLELGELGFDEILLEAAGYPGSGKLSAIAENENYPADGREEDVSSFLKELSGALEEKGVLLSVLATEDELSGGASGLTAQAAAGCSGRIWLPAGEDPAACAGLLEQAGMDQAARRLMTMREDGMSASWAGGGTQAPQ